MKTIAFVSLIAIIIFVFAILMFRGFKKGPNYRAKNTIGLLSGRGDFD